MKIYLTSSPKSNEVCQLLVSFLRLQGLEANCMYDSSLDKSGIRRVVNDAGGNYQKRSLISFWENKRWIDWADCVVMVLPGSNSAHLEIGYAMGSGKLLYLYGDVKRKNHDAAFRFADKFYSTEEIIPMALDILKLSNGIEIPDKVTH